MNNHNGPVLRKQLDSFIRKRKCTLLAVGPVSVNCVDAAIELSNEHELPMMLIASRRQVDSSKHGGGYVNGWTTSEFSKYVKTKDKSGSVYLARDHGGPWQNTIESDRNFSLEEAMESAKESYRADIDAGFTFLHIDPSIDIHGIPSTDEILNRVFDLYEFCAEYALEKSREIIFEVGTEEQNGGLNTNEILQYLLDEINLFCQKKNYALPMFVVVQTGTRVMETRNTGSLEHSIRENVSDAEIRSRIPELVDICGRSGMQIKAHNADYLSSEAIRLHPELGIQAANVAPEFGVTETRALLQLFENYSMNHLSERFLELSYQSKKWKKWMLEDTKATDHERAIISGHYVFSTTECAEIKSEADQLLGNKGIILDQFLKEKVKKQMLRYMQGFNLISN